MKNYFYKLLIKYHTYMREFYEENQYFGNPIKVIHHDLRIQRYENELGVQ